MKTKQLIVIGNGMAGMKMVEHLHSLAPNHYQISVFGAEKFGNYNRIMLSPVLAQEKSFNDIITHPFSWYESKGIKLHAGVRVTDIDPEQHTITTDRGELFCYDTLVIATGSCPFILPVPGNALDGVISFRKIDDVEAMLETAKNHQRAVVIGGGLLGLEAADGLAKAGMKVTVLHRSGILMNQQMDEESSLHLRQALEAKGIEFLMHADTAEFQGSTRVERVLLKDGRTIDADLVVMTAGIRPNTELASNAGLTVNRGIVVNDALKTSHHSIYALGECVEHQGHTYGLVAPLFEQAHVLARALAGDASARYRGSKTFTGLKVSGVQLFSAGNFNGNENSEYLVYRDSHQEVYRKLVIEDNRLMGAVLYGDTRDGNWYFDLLEKQTDISALRDNLIFGRAYCQALGDFV